MEYINFGQILITIRKQLDKTQKEFAAQVGISRSYLCDLENNRKNPSLRTMEDIAHKLDLTLVELLEQIRR